MSRFEPSLAGVPRAELERRLVEAEAMNSQATEILNAQNVELEELRSEVKRLSYTGIALPGWWCGCGTFNGEAKERRDVCRCCEGPRP